MRSLIPKKGHRFLLEAVSRIQESVPNVKLLIVGEGEERNKLERLSKTLSLKERVDFLGAREDIPRLMKIMDVFALPSLQEGFPRTLVEAMYSGLPSVASNISGIPELVEDGECGYMVDPGNIESIANRLKTLYIDAKLRYNMGAEAQEKIKTAHLPHHYVEKLENLYTELEKKKI